MSKLWIIGDSFANHDNRFWVDKVCKKFKGDEYWTSSLGSRDAQTILDIFLKNLQHIKNDDFVIMVIPTAARYRLPLQIPKNDVFFKKEKNIVEHKDFFIGFQQYNSLDENKKLEEPLTDIRETDIDGKINMFVNSSKAFKNNFNTIINSLKNYLPFEIFIWSWTDEWGGDLITSKSEIKKEIGFWETLQDEYKKTNGKYGALNNLHWSVNMHSAFADYLIVKFPQFFNV